MNAFKVALALALALGCPHAAAMAGETTPGPRTP
jgi:hypothetical protein